MIKTSFHFRAVSLFYILMTTIAVALLIFPATAQESSSTEKTLKHKIAVGRFSNETRYGQTLLRDNNLDPLGKQAADILTAYLVQTGKFLVFERPDLAKIEGEQSRDPSSSGTVGVDTLIVGSIVEFGRTEDGKRGLFNREKTQRAHAKVAIRLVDVRTGMAFFAATGAGEATTDTRTILGMGSTSRFDGTLTDKALSVAIEDMLEELVSTLKSRAWRTDILAIEAGQIYISGGSHQGINIGDKLNIVKPGKTIKSAQTGFDIQLPPTKIAEIEILSVFGDTETNEGSIAKVTSGSLDGYEFKDLLVMAD